MNMKSNMDQIVGTIVGAASGDALGARHEFHPPLTDPSPLEMGSGGAFDWRKGQWTDDTEQGIVLLRQLVQGHDLLDPEVLDRVARGLVDWGMGATDIGMQTRAALTRITPSNATAANVMAAAQAASARRLSALRAAEPELDPDMARGLAFAYLVKALARHAILAWEGIGDTSGKPLPLSPDAVERLMDLDDIAAAFWDRATAPVAAVAMEGNG